MRLFFLMFSVLTLSLATLPARAEMPIENLIGFSETEKVSFAFYHLINKEPPYMDWIQARDDYIKAGPKDRMLIMDHERMRLRDGFANYQTDRETIMVKLPLNYTLIDNPDYQKSAEARGKGLTKRLVISLPDDKAPYFPFQVGKFWVGVIPKGLEKALEIDLSTEETMALRNGLKAADNFKNKSIITNIILQPLQADAKQPMMEGDMPVFLMLSDIASLSFHGMANELLWAWSAPWYRNAQSQDLMTLHK